MSSIRSVGQWIDEDGSTRNASVEIKVEDGTACVTVSALENAEGIMIPTGDRRIAYFLGRVEHQIRVSNYVNRTITPDPKKKDEKAGKRGRV